MAIGRRALSDVHRHIENVSPDYADQLHLGFGVLLIVKPEEDAPDGMGAVVLDEDLGDTGGLKFRALVGLHEKAMRSFKDRRLDQDDLRDLNVLEFDRHL